MNRLATQKLQKRLIYPPNNLKLQPAEAPRAGNPEENRISHWRIPVILKRTFTGHKYTHDARPLTKALSLYKDTHSPPRGNGGAEAGPRLTILEVVASICRAAISIDVAEVETKTLLTLSFSSPLLRHREEPNEWEASKRRAKREDWQTLPPPSPYTTNRSPL